MFGHAEHIDVRTEPEKDTESSNRRRVGIVIAMFGTLFKGTKPTLLVPVLLSSLLFSTAPAQSSQSTDEPAAPAGKPPAAAVPRRYRPHPVSKRASEYYALIWGVDSLALKSVESGEIIRFTYRVLDANKAKMLNDKKNEPSLIDPQAGVKLVVPTLEKVGQLRQSSAPEAGKAYWMAFSNKGRYVKPGHRVNVVIGSFRADGLIVQ
jgi:hypothetical protein